MSPYIECVAKRRARNTFGVAPVVPDATTALDASKLGQKNHVEVAVTCKVTS